MRLPRLAGVLPAMALCGCAVGPAYHRPAEAASPAYRELPADAALAGPADPAALARWWTLFRDPELERLEERALRGNRDLKTAVSRVRQARAEREVAAGALLPGVDATAGYNRSRGSRNVKLPLSALGGGGGPPQGQKGAGAADPAGPASPQPAQSASAPATAEPQQGAPPGGPASPFGEGGLPGVTTSLYQAGFDAVWEIDLFGGQRRAVEAADAELAAAREGAYGVRVTLMAEVASSYLQLRLAQARAGVAARNVDSQRATLKIAKDKFDAGLGSEVDVAQETAQLSLAETQLAPLAASARLTAHALAFLVGGEPASLDAELGADAPLPALPPDLPVGVPSDLLRRRPDIRRAERELAAANAEIGVATAQLYPQFSITGLLGVDSSDLRRLPRWSSGYYSVAPGVSWPILDWARIHAAIRVQDELQRQALLSYETAVSQALRDVEDALVQYARERDRHDGLVRAADEARHARDATAHTYEEGLSDETATLVAERALFQTEDSLAQSGASLRLDLVALYKALGGGWDASAAPSPGS